MKIAIHPRLGSFSDRWIAFCKSKNIPFIEVNCCDSNIIEQIKDCDALLWHHAHGTYPDILLAKHLLYSVQNSGIFVFPDYNTCWHFDDKVSQKYLLEGIGAPLVPSYVFYEKKKALEWANSTSYPKVFKLRGGAGSANVRLIKSKKQAFGTINIAFGKGFSGFDRLGYFKDRYNKYKSGIDTFTGVLKGIARIFITTQFGRMHGREKGYVYFQDFIPNNDYDTRIIVIGERAFAIVRGVRKGDFRASGSGKISYDPAKVDLEMIKIAFDVNDKLKTQSIAFDFILDDGKPLIVEISYAYAIEAYDKCPGYWDKNLNWHEGQFNPQEWMIENLIEQVEMSDRSNM